VETAQGDEAPGRMSACAVFTRAGPTRPPVDASTFHNAKAIALPARCDRGQYAQARRQKVVWPPPPPHRSGRAAAATTTTTTGCRARTSSHTRLSLRVPPRGSPQSPVLIVPTPAATTNERASHLQLACRDLPESVRRPRAIRRS
jgi:hypothetical protein